MLAGVRKSGARGVVILFKRFIKAFLMLVHGFLFPNTYRVFDFLFKVLDLKGA